VENREICLSLFTDSQPFRQSRPLIRLRIQRLHLSLEMFQRK